MLHDRWGGVEFWQARRSMRFNKYLVDVANAFRENFLNSTDEYDKTVRPNDWRDETVGFLHIIPNFFSIQILNLCFTLNTEKSTSDRRQLFVRSFATS